MSRPVALPLRGNKLVIVNGDLATITAQLTNVPNIGSVSAPSGWVGVHVDITHDVVNTADAIRRATGTTLPTPIAGELVALLAKRPASDLSAVAGTALTMTATTNGTPVSASIGRLADAFAPMRYLALPAPVKIAGLLPAPAIELTLVGAGEQIKLAAAHISLVDVLDANYRYYSCFDEAAMLSRARTENHETTTLTIVGRETSVYLLGIRTGYALEAVA